MSFSNFKPTIWSRFIQTELEKKCKLVDDCNRQFEGEARLGGRVKILGAVAPEIFDYDASDPRRQYDPGGRYRGRSYGG